MKCSVFTGFLLMILLSGFVIADDAEPKNHTEVPTVSEVGKVLADGKKEPVILAEVKSYPSSSPAPLLQDVMGKAETFQQVVGNLLTQLLQAPVVFINAISRAISRLTGSTPVPYR